MSEFLVETYAPRDTASALARRVEEFCLAAEQVGEKGADVRLQRAIPVPEDETCFYMSESSAARAVREAVRRAGLQPDRIGHPAEDTATRGAQYRLHADQSSKRKDRTMSVYLRSSRLKLASTHRLSRPLVVGALILASCGTAIAAESASRGNGLVAKPHATTAVHANVGRAAFGKPRRSDGSLVPHLGR
jgi:hypothetical protein